MRQVEARKSSEIYNRKRRIGPIQQGVWKWTEKLIDLDQGGLVRALEQKSEEKAGETLGEAIWRNTSGRERWQNKR